MDAPAAVGAVVLAMAVLADAKKANVVMKIIIHANIIASADGPPQNIIVDHIIGQLRGQAAQKARTAENRTN